MKTLLCLMTSLFALNAFACADNFNGKFREENSGYSTLEIKVIDCTPKLELSFPAERRVGHVTADNVNRIIWDRDGRTISETASVSENVLAINIVDKNESDTFYQSQVYTLTPSGLELDIEVFNQDRSYDSKKHFTYQRD